MAKYPPSGLELQAAFSCPLPAHLRAELGSEERTKRKMSTDLYTDRENSGGHAVLNTSPTCFQLGRC